MAASLDETTLAVLRAVAAAALDVLGRAEFNRIVAQSTAVREIDGTVLERAGGGVVCGTSLGKCFLTCEQDPPAPRTQLLLGIVPCASGPYAGWVIRHRLNDEGWQVRTVRGERRGAPRAPLAKPPAGGAGGGAAGGGRGPRAGRG